MHKMQPIAGDLIREWRHKRRLSQLHLALDAEISQRHLSFVESGRSRPSREMVMKLCEHMQVPLRQRNDLLVAAGFAPIFEERALTDKGLQAAMSAVQKVLTGHEPYPAFAVDRGWNMIAANRAIEPFLKLVSEPALVAPPVNVLKLALHPGGLAPHMLNLPEWRGHLLGRLRQQIAATADEQLIVLERELSAYPGRVHHVHDPARDIAVSMQIRFSDKILSFISTVTVFGTPLDVTLSELAIESFFPADDETAGILHAGTMR